MSDDDEIYFLWDLTRKTEARPGEMVSFRVRARDERAARTCAANRAGLEGRETWESEDLVEVECHGPAVVQWHGVVQMYGFGWEEEVPR